MENKKLMRGVSVFLIIEPFTRFNDIIDRGNQVIWPAAATTRKLAKRKTGNITRNITLVMALDVSLRQVPVMALALTAQLR